MGDGTKHLDYTAWTKVTLSYPEKWRAVDEQERHEADKYHQVQHAAAGQAGHMLSATPSCRAITFPCAKCA